MKVFRYLIAVLMVITMLTSCASQNGKQWPEYESGEWPDVCSVWLDASQMICVAVDEVQVVETVFFTMNADLYTRENQQGSEYYQLEVVIDDPNILEVVDINKDKLMDLRWNGGLTIKGLAPGETKITLVMTYLPTGGTHTTSATVTVTADTTE